VEPGADRGVVACRVPGSAAVACVPLRFERCSGESREGVGSHWWLVMEGDGAEEWRGGEEGKEGRSRRTAAGVLAIELVQPIEMTLEHDQGECVARVVASPTACRRVLQEMTRFVRSNDLIGDPKWEPALDAFGKFAQALDQHRVSSLGFGADRTGERPNLCTDG
jgi:hypothetical protein